jgi:hypothetical protein
LSVTGSYRTVRRGEANPLAGVRVGLDHARTTWG